MKTFIGLRCNRDYTKRNGTNALYLLVGIDKQFSKLTLNIDWPKALVDEPNNQVIGRTDDDKEANDNNLLIRKEISRANDILIEARLQEQELSMADFLDKFNNHLRHKDFLVYMHDKIRSRARRNKIADSTRKSQLNAYLWLKEYRKTLPFKDLNKKLIENFEEWLSRQTSRRIKTEKKRLDGNTIANVLKYVKAYINLAIDDNIPMVNPFKDADVQVHQNVKPIEHLRPGEVAQLITYYNKIGLPLGEKLSLCRLLIACHLSLRISDIMKINSRKLADMTEDRRLIFHPTKQVRTKKLKTVYLYIDDRALTLVQDCVTLQHEAFAKGLKISETFGRKVLKKIGLKIGLDVSGFHIGRHSFATTYIRAGGKVTNLQQIMGHTNINTTMRYVHIVEADTDEEMISLSNMYQDHVTAQKKSGG